MFKKLITISLGTGLIVGCASNANLSSSSDSINNAYQEEIAYIDRQIEQLHSDLNRRGLLIKNGPLANYPQAKLEELAIEPSRLNELKVHVIRSSEPNAFAIGRNDIFVSTGLIAFTRNENELKAVLAHEYAHLENYHSLQGVLTTKQSLAGATALHVLTAGLTLGVGYIAAADAIATESREHELQADHDAAQLLLDSGIDYRYLNEFLERINSLPDYVDQESTWYATHPETSDRVNALNTVYLNESLSAMEAARDDASFHGIRLEAMALSGYALLAQNRYYEASLLFYDTVNANPNDANLNLMLGKTLLNSAQNFDRYEEDKLRYLTADENTGAEGESDSTSENKKAAAERDQERLSLLEAARVHASLALDSEQSPEDSPRILGDIYVELEQPDQALRYYNLYLQQYPEAIYSRLVERKINNLKENQR